MQQLYSVPDTTLLLDSSPEYVLRIRDLPPEEKPREKLLKYGPAVMATHELLAVILTTGTQKEDILSMSKRVLTEYGERSFATQTDAKALAQNLGIPMVKAMQIIACAELGRRFFKKTDYGPATIRTADDVFEYTKGMRALAKEHLRGVYLNAHHRVIYDEVISIGTVNANLIHPREVFKPALEYVAAAVILVHNHPSGSTDPSLADIEITKQLVEAGAILGITLLDHVIVTKDAYASIPVNYA